MRTPDAVLQEIWQIKDAAYKNAQGNSQRFVEQLRLRSAQLRLGLDLKEMNMPMRSSASLAARSQSPN